MTKKDKALIVEGLNRICADVAALAAIMESGRGGEEPMPVPPILFQQPDSNQEHGDGPACSMNVELQDRPRPLKKSEQHKQPKTISEHPESPQSL